MDAAWGARATRLASVEESRKGGSLSFFSRAILRYSHSIKALGKLHLSESF